MLTTRYVACLPEAWLEALEAYRRAADARDPLADQPPVAERIGSELVIRIDGIVLPTRVAGMRCAPVDEMLDALRDLRGVEAVTLIVDSPGGVAQGVDVLHARLMEVRADIPITARVDGLCASAAYWIASAANRIVARPIAEVGGIGVYRVYYDRSEALREAGVRPVVIRSGSHKAVGLDAVTDEQERVELENVLDVAREFERAVAAGRGLDPADVAVLASGRTWVARRALTVGLIDSVDQADRQPSADDEEAKTMTNDTTVGAAAVAAEEPVATDTPAAAQAEAAGPEAEDQASAVAAAERERCAAIMETFANDPAFAARMIREGISLTDAKAIWFDERRGGTPTSATTASAVEPVEPISVEPISAREAVRRIAEERGIPLSRAWATYWREQSIIK